MTIADEIREHRALLTTVNNYIERNNTQQLILSLAKETLEQQLLRLHAMERSGAPRKKKASKAPTARDAPSSRKPKVKAKQHPALS